MSNSKFSRIQRGQGMTEYIIIVALISIAAIGVYNMFGKTVREQTSAMAYGLAGNDSKSTGESTKASKMADGAGTAAEATKGLSNFGQDSGTK